MNYCIEFQRKPGTINATQAQRARRLELTALSPEDARAKAKHEAKRLGFARFFDVSQVRKI